jgi:outer membrane lipoprotein SlyB
MKTPFILSLAFLLLLTNCAKNISSNEYSETEVGAVKHTYRGAVISARNVKVNGADSLGDNQAGLIGGGLAGGILGSQPGKGRGSSVGLVLGAAAGALGGAFAEKGLKSQEGIEYSVELSSGRIMTLVQGTDHALSVGQRVLVMVGSKGRSRIVPDHSPVKKKTAKKPSSNARRGRTIVVIED